jgi:serine/threonine protein kinase
MKSMLIPVLILEAISTTSLTTRVTERIRTVGNHDRRDEVGYPRLQPSFLHWQFQNYEMLPNWLISRKRTPGMSLVKFRKVVARTTQTMVAAIDKNLVITYKSYCLGHESRDVVMADVFFMNLLKGTDITTRPVYYSREMFVPKPAGDTGKVSFGECRGGSILKVRYLISQAFGESLSIRLNLEAGGKFDPLEAIDYGIQLFGLLEQLHARGIVHAGIHPGNVLISDDKVRLIDFVNADLVDAQTFSGNVRDESVPTVCHPHIAQWEMIGYVPSFRDDAYRVFVTIAQMIHGPEFLRVHRALCASPSEMTQYMHLKQEANFLDIPEPIIVAGTGYSLSLENSLGSDAWYDKPECSYIGISHSLNGMLNHIRSLQISRVPNYVNIHEALMEIKDCLNPDQIGDADMFFGPIDE